MTGVVLVTVTVTVTGSVIVTVMSKDTIARLRLNTLRDRDRWINPIHPTHGGRPKNHTHRDQIDKQERPFDEDGEQDD